MRYTDSFYPGLHPAIVDAETWAEANKSTDTVEPREFKFKDEHIHLLKGLLHCGECGHLMTPFLSGKKDKEGKRYLYYTCTSVTKMAGIHLAKSGLRQPGNSRA